ncbi:hypothetical protein [Actinokineospora terrae]|nr:hypothetical protein [Actinokineospora terrae]
MTYTLVHPTSGAVVGVASFRYSQEIELSASSAGISSDVELVMTGGTGVLLGLTATVTVSCGTGCVVDSGALHSEPMSTGSTLEAGTDVSATIPGGGRVSPRFTTSITFTQPGAVPTQPASIVSASGLRCDSEVGQSAGCVFTQALPQVVLSLSDPAVAQAAAGYAWAQQTLTDHWGTGGNSLRREADPTVQASNRGIVCDATFVRSTSYNTPDSCDEFAFASTKQSGAQLGLAGSACAEIYPFQVNGSWYAQVISGGASSRCVRAHVQSTVNSNVGARLANMAISQRVLDNDPYQLVITT